MSVESELMIKEYEKNPLCNYEMKDADVTRHEGNFICWDDVTVYLKIKDDKIVEKKKLSLPEKIVNLAKCNNPRCITSIEKDLDQIFILTDKENEIYRCKYCEMSLKKK